MRTNEIKNEIDRIEEWHEKIERKDWKCETKKYIYDFQQYETIRSFGESIFYLKVDIVKVDIVDIVAGLNLDQDQKKLKIKKVILMKTHMLFIRVEN